MHRTARSTLPPDTAWAAAIALLVALFVASPLLAGGLPDTALGPLHLLQVSLLDGAGSPNGITLTAAPVPIVAGSAGTVGLGPFAYAAEAASLFGFGLQDSLKVAVALLLLIAAMGAYLAMRQLVSPLAAALAAAAYVCSPTVLQAAYVLGTYGRLCAYALAPLCLWGLLHLADRPTRLGFVVLSTSMAIVLAADTTTALVLLPLAAAAAIVGATRLGWGSPAAICLALLVATLIAAPAWTAQTADLIEAMAADLDARSLSLGDLLAVPRIADARAANPRFPRGLGGHLVLLAVPCVALLGTGGPRARAGRIVLAALLAGTAYLLLGFGPDATTADQAAVLGLAAMALAALVGTATDAWHPGGRQRAAWLGLAFAAILLGATPYLFPPRAFVDWSGLSRAELLACATGLDTAATGCPASAAALLDPVASPVPGLSVATVSPDGVAFTIGLDSPQTVVLPIARASGWVATTDGTREALAASPGQTLVTLDVPAGSHTVALVADPSRARTVPGYLTLSGLLALAVLVRWLPAARRRPVLPGGELRLTMVLAIASAALLVAKVLYVEPHTSLFRSSSPDGQALAATHETTADFGGALALIGYTMQRNLPPQGEPMVVTLYLQPLLSRGDDVSVTVSIEAPTTGEVLASSSHVRPGGVPARTWSTDQYLVDTHEIDLPADLPAVSYDLRVVVTDVATGAPLPTAPGENEARLDPVQVLYHLPLDVKRFAGDSWYRFGDDIRLLGSDVSTAYASPGGSLSLTLYWRADTAVQARMTRFVDLVAGNGRIVAQVDSWAVDGLYPTDRWLPQHNIADTVRLRVPMSATPGEYHLVVGLHDPDTLALPSVSTRGGTTIASGAVVLPTTVVIE